MSDENTVVGEISNTQRISLKHNKDSVTILKEFRRKSGDNWITSKGIEIPDKVVPPLVDNLNKRI